MRLLLTFLCLPLMTAGWGTPSHAAQVVASGRMGRVEVPLLAGWRVHVGDAAGAELASFDDRGWVANTLPHTFNGADGDDGGSFYRGPAWYRRTLMLGVVPPSRRLWLQFDGAALTADIYVNGRHIGRHEGGHARFRVDATAALRAGENVIAVKVDNTRVPSIAPLGGDFTLFGGLYRSVSLIETDVLHVDLADAGGPGLTVETRKLDDRAATLAATVRLRNDSVHRSTAMLVVSVRDADGRTVAEARRSVPLSPDTTVPVEVPLALPNPHLWNGRADPYLYHVTAELAGGDAVTVPLGLRTATFDPQRGFLLNGHAYPLYGVDFFNSGRPGRGLAVTPREIDDDMQILDDLGVTALRLVHFQHPQEAYDEADRRGIVLWTEIGLNGVIDGGPAFQANVEQQMRELIRQNRAHPSVVLWGLGNEVYATTPDVTRVLQAVQAVAHAEDPSRPTIYAHCCQADDVEKAQVSDLIGFNRYFGWYPKQKGLVGDWADGYHARYPRRVFGVSEYGAGGSIRQQQEPPLAENVPESDWHPEQAQTAYHLANWPQLAARPYLFGTFVWVGFDLASDGRHEGERPGINDKGLVTYDRAVRKDAYYFYQANWSARPMLHIADGRLLERRAQSVLVRVFTNAPAATLAVNGRTWGTAQVRGGVAEWPAVPLDYGETVVTASATATDGTSLRETVRWVRTAVPASGAGPTPQVRRPVPSIPDTAPPGQEKRVS